MHDASGDAKRMAEQRLRQQEIVIGQRWRTAVLLIRTRLRRRFGTGDVEAIFRPAFCNNKKSRRPAPKRKSSPTARNCTPCDAPAVH